MFLVNSEEESNQRPDEFERVINTIRDDPGLLQRVIDSVRSVLEAAADGERSEFILRPGSKLVFDPTQPGRVILSDSEPLPAGLEQAITTRAMQYLGTQVGSMLSRCQRRLRCGRVFRATRSKQIFCSRKCASAAAFESHKAAIGEKAFKENHRKTARQSWRLKQQKLGRTVKPRIKDKKGKMK